MADDPRDDDEVARAWSGKRGTIVTYLLGAVAVGYFASIWAEAAIHQGTAGRFLPAPLAYFAQLAVLFEKPVTHVHDYRVEGYRCRDRTWFEIDTSPWFPIDADSKENRLYRAVFFYRERSPHRPTMRALDEFVVSHYDADRIDAASRGQSSDLIGGMRVVKILAPVSSPSTGTPRFARAPLSSYPEDQRTDIYHTPESMREERCKQLGP
jgi:hypothetical protein